MPLAAFLFLGWGQVACTLRAEEAPRSGLRSQPPTMACRELARFGGLTGSRGFGRCAGPPGLGASKPIKGSRVSGDSITQGWGEDFSKRFPGMKIANRGISGDTTRGMLIRLQPDVLALNPTAVVMLMGTNDLEEQAEPEVIAGNFKLIIEALKKHNPKLPIVVCQVFPSSESKRRPAEKIKKINELYFQAVKGDPRVTVIETGSCSRTRRAMRRLRSSRTCCTRTRLVTRSGPQRCGRSLRRSASWKRKMTRSPTNPARSASTTART